MATKSTKKTTTTPTTKKSTPASVKAAALAAAVDARQEQERRAAAAALLNEEASDRLRAAESLTGPTAPASTPTPPTPATPAATPRRWGGVFGKAARWGCLSIFVLALVVGASGAALVALSTTVPTTAPTDAPISAPADVPTSTPADAPASPTTAPADVPTSTPADAPASPTTAPAVDVEWGAPIPATLTFGEEGNPNFTADQNLICWGAERVALEVPQLMEVPASSLRHGGCAPTVEFYGQPLRRLQAVGAASGWHQPDLTWSWLVLG